MIKGEFYHYMNGEGIMEENHKNSIANEDKEYAYEIEEKVYQEERKKFNDMFYDVFKDK